MDARSKPIPSHPHVAVKMASPLKILSYKSNQSNRYNQSNQTYQSNKSSQAIAVKKFENLIRIAALP